MKKKLDIIYEDKELLILNKPSKLLTIGTEKEKNRTLYYEASQYVKKQYPKNKVFIVNRLDKDTSGIVVFAKNEYVKKKMQEHWNKIAKVREYYAIVEGKVSEAKGVLQSYLVEDKTLKVHSTKDKKGSLAITCYETLQSSKAYSLLRVQIKTGKKHQIRVQLSEMGHPIVGDKKYGSTKNPMGRMGLHANLLKLDYFDKQLTLVAKAPKEFKTIFENIELFEKNN